MMTPNDGSPPPDDPPADKKRPARGRTPAPTAPPTLVSVPASAGSGVPVAGPTAPGGGGTGGTSATSTGGGGATGGGGGATGSGGSSGGGNGGGSGDGGNTTSTGTTPAAKIPPWLSAVGRVALQGAVAVARYGLVPLAELYAPAPASQANSLGTNETNRAQTTTGLTVNEIASLNRATSKAACEAGDLLLANYPVVPEGKTVPPCTPNENGRYPAPSLQHFVAAAKGANAVYQAYQERKVLAQRQTQDTATARAPLTLAQLRQRRG